MDWERQSRLVLQRVDTALLHNPWRQRMVRREQELALRARDMNCERAIIFIVPGFDRVDGGILSLHSLIEESSRLSEFHGATVFACTFPGEPAISKYTQFDNNLQLLDYKSIAFGLPHCREFLIHIPECYVRSASKLLALKELKRSGIELSINILLQNIDFIPTREQVDGLRLFGTVTVTTAHKAYATVETSERLGAPLFHISVWNCPERYEVFPYEEKKNILLVSPDEHPMRHRVMKALHRALPDYEFRVVRKMPYRDYRALCDSAKFALTFGEGLDGYYVETIFSGGLACAVYNDRFFTPKYLGLPLMFGSWDEVICHLPSKIRQLDNNTAYTKAWQAQFEVTESDYRYTEYLQNLVSFYTNGVSWALPLLPSGVDDQIRPSK